MKNKRIISVFTIVAIVLSTIVVTGFAFAQNKTTIYSSLFGEVSAGENIRIPISIKNNTGLMGFMLEFSYDSDVITPTSVSYGDMLSGGLQDNIEGDAEPGSFKVYWAGSENLSNNGILFFIDAKVSESAIGETAIQVNYSQSDTFDENFNDVELTCENIELNIENSSLSQYAKITSSANDAVAGKNVEVKLSISEITNVNSLNLKLDYNSDNFNFVSAASTASMTYNNSDSSLQLSIGNITAALNNSNFVSIVFKAKDKAASGKYSFVLSSEDEGIICKSCSAIVLPSATSEVAQISIPDGIAVEKNEIAEIPVMISNNHGIMGYRLTFNYNPSEIEILSIKGSNDISGEVYDSVGDKPSSFAVLWNYTSEISIDGILFSIEVKNISDAYSESPISISYSQQDTFNEKYEDVVFDCKDGTVILCPGHSYNQRIVNPTCTQKGYTEYTCKNCKATYKDNYTDESGHYYQYTGNQKDFVMTYVCEDCGEELSIGADEVFAMWEARYINTKPNNTNNRTKNDNSSLLNVVENGIINAKDYALLLSLQKSDNN